MLMNLKARIMMVMRAMSTTMRREDLMMRKRFNGKISMLRI
jgi:hypothetical protein